MPVDSFFLRQIPKVDELLAHPIIMAAARDTSHQEAVNGIRAVLGELRQAVQARATGAGAGAGIGADADPGPGAGTDAGTGSGARAGATAGLPALDDLAGQIAARIRRQAQPCLRRVVNATGVILHTNLGRAPLAAAAAEAILAVATGHSNLEYNLREGVRGSRHDHTAGLLTELTGAEAALVVNNNAGAMLLALDTLAKGKEVIVSRGELVEIGGSFRVPEVIACSGCALVEVGATNKTRIADVERAIDSEKTGALLKVHTSNFRIEGFTQAVSLAELTALGQKYGLPVIHDLGSGCLLSPWPGLDEPTVSESVRAGADAICFSGDKLLGGPQSGIILGRRDYIARMRNNPLVRALRVDKLTLAALEATLRLYWDPERARREIPVLAMLFAERKSLRAKARRLKRLLDKTPAGAFCALADTEGQVGGGAMPGQTLPSAAVAVTATDSISLTALEEYLRRWETPIIARVSRERLLLDVLAVAEKDFPLVAACLAAAFASALAKEGDKL